MKSQTGTLSVCLIILTAFLACLPAYETALAQGGTGGDIMHDGEYTIHTFYENDTFTPPAGVDTVEVLVVGGGGGGGGGNTAPLFSTASGGGGGAGGLLYEANYPLNGAVPVTVGEGGSGGGTTNPGVNGGNSAFSGLNAVGGGGGGGVGANRDGNNGGSGGGGGSQYGQGGQGTPGQGNAGGSSDLNHRADGGGGADTPGEAANGGGGDGGDGLSYPQFAHAGTGGWFAGGGGGGGGPGIFGLVTYPGGTGGIGGGANGGTNSSGASAPPNTGGGGGGGGGNNAGGNGGSGIVIVRYATPENTITVENDVSMTIGPGITLAGEGHAPVTDDTATLGWTSAPAEGETNKITARIDFGAVPAGLELRVDTDRPGVDPLILDVTDQDFVTGIGSESVSGQILTYTLEVVDCSQLFATTETIAVEYTITAEP